jgi:hypothetical protein
MEHNQKLIEIINNLNAKEAKQRASVNKIGNSVRTVVEDVPANDILKSYLKKFKSFKAKVNSSNTSVEEDLIDTVDDISGEAKLERYSRKDERVFTNKAKKSDTQVTNMRWKQYSNTKGTLTSDQRMAPLRLDKYSS